MNIDSSMGMMTPVNASTQGGARPPGPPPGGQIPPGLEQAVSTLSESDQAEIRSALESFTPEQHEQLKAKLDELKPSAQSMSSEEIGATFLEYLTEITGKEMTNTTNNEHLIDTYA